MENISAVLYVMLEWWSILCIVALLLIVIRRDSRDLYYDWLEFMFRPFPLWILTLIITFFMLPPSIPFSLMHLFKDDDSQ